MSDPLLPAILAAPDDDVPRLIYADWLDENGQPERAEFVRLQCAIAQAGAPDLAMKAREKALLAAHGATWLAPLKVRGEPLFSRGTHGQFVRGFVERVWMPARLFLWKADKLFARTPANELRVTRATFDDLADLLTDPRLAQLRTLDLSDRQLGTWPDLIRRLSVSAAARSLTRLRLRACGLTDAAAFRLADDAAGWELRELDVSLNPLGPAAVAALRRTFGDRAVRWDG